MSRPSPSEYVPDLYGRLSALKTGLVSIGIGGPCSDTQNAYYREYQYSVGTTGGVDTNLIAMDLDDNGPVRPVNYLIEYTTTITKQTPPTGSTTRTDLQRFNIPIGGNGTGTQLGRTSQITTGTDPSANLSIQYNQVSGLARVTLRFSCSVDCLVTGFVTISGTR
jgi:hypothetical protein